MINYFNSHQTLSLSLSLSELVSNDFTKNRKEKNVETLIGC